MPQRQAAEKIDIFQARDHLVSSIEWVVIVLRRLSTYLPSSGSLKILEVGSAQGRGLIGISKTGHKSYGLEPYFPAIQIAKQLTAEESTSVFMLQGRAEEIPYKSNSFDLVLAFAVMEHVKDLSKSLTEIVRVLKPGGIFWFSSASSMCPIQGEIDGFPLFGWYPDWIKNKIMTWAVLKHPGLVGYTDHPAIHWWTPLNARHRLREAGFEKVWDRWDLRLPSEDPGFYGIMIKFAKRFYVIRTIGDIFSSGCSYAARKSIQITIEKDD